MNDVCLTEVILDIPNKKKFKSIYDLLNSLPIDIKRKIYEDYIRVPYLYMQYNIVLNSIDSQKLIIKDLYNMYMKMKNIPYLINYFRKNDEIFNDLYRKHYILDNKNFRKLDDDKSFILSILFTLYH